MSSASSPHLLRHIIDAAQEAIIVVAPSSLTITAVNRTACLLLGYAREELIGQPVSTIECSLQDLFFWEELGANPSFEGARVIEGEWLTRSGAALPVQKSITSIMEDGAPCWIMHVTDLSRQQKHEEEQLLLVAQLQTALEATAEGILVTDLQGGVVNFNRKFATMWQLPEDAAALQSQSYTFEHIQAALQDPAEFSASLATMEALPDNKTENLLALADGRYIVCVSKPQIMRDRVLGRVYSFRDITDMKRAESELVLARDAAEQASLVKSQFLSQMSHELRTPLNAIIGFAQLLEMESSGAAREQLATITRAGRHLLSVINEILDVAKIEAGRIELESLAFSPLHVIREVEELIEVQLREKQVALNVRYGFPLPAQIRNDPTRFRQILLNLCSNAVKYTERGSIDIAVSGAGEMLEVAITDSGIGISAEQQKKLFAAFSQADSSTTRRYGGTGLGLYISAQLVHMLGGTIGVTSTPGVGSTFRFSIATGPLAGVPMLASLDDARAQAALATISHQVPRLGGHVLLAEDGIDNQRLIRAYLDKAGVAVTVVENGRQAVEHALAGSYDLILMDMQMPVMNGLEATLALRRAGYAGPIVALTANVMQEDVDSYLAAGCSCHLPKPLDLEKFFQTLGGYLPAPHDDKAPAAAADFDEAAFLRELAGEFLEALPDTRRKIADAAQREDGEALNFVTHTLKGTAGSFGFGQISETAQRLLEALRLEEKEAVRAATAALLETIDACLVQT